MHPTHDVIILGAGAAGMMCAITAGQRQRRVLMLEQANKAGRKILMSGGGRCNFTNRNIDPECFIAHNPHFCISALKRYTQWDFIKMVEDAGIPYHEKTLGQLFCDHKASDITNMLLQHCQQHKVQLRLKTTIDGVKHTPSGYVVVTNQGRFCAPSLVVATGGLSIPSMGSSPFGYRLAKQFGLHVWPTRAGLVPLTLHDQDKKALSALAGVSFNSRVRTAQTTFHEHTLCTHRGLSGPAILQISSYWQPGTAIAIDALPEHDMAELLRQHGQQQQLKNLLAQHLPKRLVALRLPPHLATKPCQTLTPKEIAHICNIIHNWQIHPNGTEGYRTAEVTLGGVDCDALSSKTMEAKNQPGLYFIGEVVDVTGWLGGYNFQWAWSSGFAAGKDA